MVAAVIHPEYVDYMPRGGCKDFYTATQPEVLAVGPAGTGKTLAACWKLHHIALRVPGVRLLMARKVLEDLKTGALATYTNHVKPELDGVVAFGGNRFYPGEFRYPNGSVMHVVGMDKPGKVMSAEYDVIFVNEATEINELTWQTLKSRLRNGVLGYQQLIGDCNPSGPRHWLNVRCNEGRTRRIITTHKDNPAYWDDGLQQWTTMGRQYVQGTLASLTGVQRSRLFEGSWVAAEGLVYPEFTPEMIREVNTAYWRTELGVDVGTRNPTAILTVHFSGDDRQHISHEVYRRNMTATEIIDAICAQADATKADAIHIDPSAKAYIDDLRARGYPAVSATNDVLTGIQLVHAAIAGGATIDPSCENLIEELGMYVYPDNPRIETDKPVKDYDHACFVAGTVIETLGGMKPIESVTTDDWVRTRNGFCKVANSGVTHDAALVFTARFSDGTRLTGTGNHPIWVESQGWVVLEALRYDDIIQTWNQSHSMESYSDGIPTLRGGLTGNQSKVGRLSGWLDSMPSARWLISGMGPTLALNGIGSMASEHGRIASLSNRSANNAERRTNRSSPGKQVASARTTARAHGDERLDWMMKTGSAHPAANHSEPTNTRGNAAAPVSVLSVTAETKPHPVYNLTVIDTHEYFANGVLVHNCDAWRYVCGGQVRDSDYSELDAYMSRQIGR